MWVITLRKYNKLFSAIRGRLVTTYLSIIILTLLFISTYILASINQYLFDQIKVEVLANANVVANITKAYLPFNTDRIEGVFEQIKLKETTRTIITDHEARVIFDSNRDSTILNKSFLKEEIVIALKGTDCANIEKNKDVGAVIHAAVPMLSEGKIIGAVYVVQSAKTTFSFIQDIRLILIFISIVVCILIGVLSAVMADVITSPIENLTTIIKSMQNGNINQHVDVKGVDEISQLGAAFNNLTDRLNEVEEKRRSFVSNASHELKTPLSSIKILADSILAMPQMDQNLVKEFVTDINGEVDRLTKIIDRLLSLTKLDIEYERLDLKSVEINDFVDRISKTLKPIADKKKVRFEFISSDEFYAIIDKDRCFQVVYNIIDNAIKYTPSGGEVILKAYAVEDKSIIEVKDTGIGIPKEELRKVFDRFYRVDKARARDSGGTGLGLSIAYDIIKLHGGDIQVESMENVGTKFIIILPIQPM